MKSLYIVQFANKNASSIDIQTASLGGNATNTEIKKIKNGVSFESYFNEFLFGLKIEITINDNALVVRIPQNSIVENGDNKIVAINVLPFMGASTDDENGYFVYPSGSGELYNFKPISKRMNSIGEYRLSVFSSGSATIDEMTGIKEPYENSPPVLMPIFGVKRGENGFLANIVEGQYNSAINIATSGVIINANRIGAELIYRNSYKVNDVGISASGGKKKPSIHLFDENIIAGEREIRYSFLEGSNANYTGMANAYKEYLLSNGLLNKAIKASDKIPAVIDIIGGVQKKSLLFKFFIPLTTFDQTKKFLEDLKQKGITSAVITLNGWSNTGLGAYPVSLNPTAKLGGKLGLENLIKLCNKNEYKILLNTNLTILDKKVGGFSLSKDAATDNSNSQYIDSTETKFLQNPSSALEKNIKLINAFKKYTLNGVSYEKFGQYIFSAFNDKNSCTSKEAAQYYNEILSQSVENFGNARVEGGNSYILKHATMINKLQLFTKQFLLSDEQIPFYQIVVHGSIPYTTTPVNLFYDNTLQRLKLIEYGYIPSFELTEKRPDALKDTNYNKLFASQISDWRENVIDYYKIYNEELGFTYSESITNHQKLSEGLYKTTYQTGWVYINYSEKPVTYNGVVIKAKDFVVERSISYEKK
jgi:hypothetical protein